MFIFSSNETLWLASYLVVSYYNVNYQANKHTLTISQTDGSTYYELYHD